MRLSLLLLGVVALALPVHSETVDVIEPYKKPPSVCVHGCAVWADLAGSGNPTNQTAVNELWRNHTLLIQAGSSCAQPGRSPFSDGSTTGGYAGAYCYCKDIGVTDEALGYCESGALIPEQINLQVSGPDVVVAAFVTFGELGHGDVPVVELGTAPGALSRNYTGITHTYLSPSSDSGVPQVVRKYNMHFVVLDQ